MTFNGPLLQRSRLCSLRLSSLQGQSILSLWASFIIYKDHWFSSIIQLLLITTSWHDVNNGAKYPKITLIWLLSHPCFIRSLATKTFCGRSVQIIDAIIDNFSPKLQWHIFALEHAFNHRHDGLILPCYHTIFLRYIRGS